MKFFPYRDGALCAEAVPLSSIADRFGTPCYVYSRAALEAAYGEFSQACAGRDTLICYAVKANSNLALLNLFSRLGAGFDIVSGGELARVLAAGGNAAKTVFSGVGKSDAEIRAALAAGVSCFNVESEPELRRLSSIATGMRTIAPVALRVNPDIDAKSHPYISTGLQQDKFGVPYDDAIRLYGEAARLPGLRISGIGFHIGSQITDLDPFVASLERILELVDRLTATGTSLSHLDLGGGLGIRYREEHPPSVKEYMDRLFGRLGSRRVRLVFEPGRRLVGEAGLLLTRVEYLKNGATKRFAIVDAAMNDLIRPALYEAWHEVLPVSERSDPMHSYDVVGPVCESGDFLALNRRLALHDNDLLAIMSAGAYGMSMSSNYNTRPRPAEVMVDGSDTHLIRPRETVESLFASERFLP